MSINQTKDPDSWSLTNVFHYPEMQYIDEAHNKACKQEPTIPVIVKWMNVSAGLLF